MSSPSSDEPNLDSGERNNCTTIGTDLVDHAIFKSGSSMKRLSSRNASLFCSCSNTSVGALGSSQKLITFIIPGYFFWFVGIGSVLVQSHFFMNEEEEYSKFSVSYTVAVDGNEQAKKDRQELVELISLKAVRGMLADFMAQEFSIENLKFILSVWELRDKNDDLAKSKALVRSIYDQFISDQSELCVNISFDCRRRIQTSVLEPERIVVAGSPVENAWKVFAEAEDEILDLIARDTFRRFKLQSKQFRDWKTEGVILKEMELV
eukprot:TRINITY_DN24171_c0_g1_i3.p1 TRINITY_DN24171_c0_g1~~TRINITY_DN24171_c0_g1_i3.p1  ORF type:complete len:264 (-),score=80.68 TRINITY_DN24171_c0_g1_i3:14-805(-)